LDNQNKTPNLNQNQNKDQFKSIVSKLSKNQSVNLVCLFKHQECLKKSN